MLKIALAATSLIAVGISDDLQASNFGYSYIGVDLTATEFDEPIIFGNTEYRGVIGGTLSGAYQFNDSIAIWLNSSTLSADGDQTEISYTETLFGLAFPFPVANRLDVTPLLGQAVLNAEACYENVCSEDGLNSLFWGVQSRAWLALDLVEVTGTWLNPVDDELDSSWSLGVALWPDEHSSVRYGFSAGDEDSSYALGYRYTW
ncbi:hypothetical protein [Saccharospirillum impatiens]|uniref:hypothetical protein n=1 Tax=Saccharospirillum impatiens TaxID=169438 RepID=UPI00048B0274|nr:hypothetical protein [Saccharospirillum impatiens]